MFMRKQIVYIDSEGSEIEKNIIEVFPSIQVMGMDAQGVTHSRKFSPPRVGDTRGWETLDLQMFSENAERIVRELNQVLAAEDCPKEDRSVILLPGIMFLQTHETIGHALELDRILGIRAGVCRRLVRHAQRFRPPALWLDQVDRPRRRDSPQQPRQFRLRR